MFQIQEFFQKTVTHLILQWKNASKLKDSKNFFQLARFKNEK